MIGVVAPYSDFKKEIKQIASSMTIPIVVEVGALQAGLSKAKQMIRNHEVKVIVARGVTANFLKSKLDIPIIKIDVTNYDIVRTINDAKKIDKSIVLIDHFESSRRIDLSTISEMLNVDIDLKLYENERDISNHIHEVAKTKENKPIVGTAECMRHTAGKIGVQSFIVFSQTDSMTESLLRAQESLEYFSKERKKQKHLQSIISSAFDGVISMNSKGIITVCNDVAANYLGIHSKDIINRKAKNIQLMLFKKLVGDYSPASKQIIKNGNKSYVLNRVRLGEKSMVITFQETESFLVINDDIRSELYQRRFFAKHKFDDIIYRGNKMEQVIALGKAYANSESNILVYGESGIGKELMAQSIHNESKRKTGPFIAVNCAALPENLLESELFGYEEGAFTGAKKGGKPGLFEMAHGGTIFLDEIGDISPTLQARLLRVLQEKEVRRIGGERILSVDFRVISATNKNLIQSVEKEEFRRDLYYRLNVLHLFIPALRHRREDIEILLDTFLEKHGVNSRIISETTRRLLIQYDWPGNIREMENFIERVSAVDDHYKGTIINLLDKKYQEEKSAKKDNNDLESEYLTIKVESMEGMERQIIAELLIRHDGNRSSLAEVLGISRTTLWKRMKEQAQVK
ncbi:sigma 54-interacting transcriptional regulator [Pseudogracilibacillus sp. SO30301A]|uniref:sigma 54-interacting transcriptional regulator n=1 Tax=Pseudogracilibacillus sp. SO30301A TaxID=3098291 RepID=UPI00300E6158